jgi:hypothetical protein
MFRSTVVILASTSTILIGIPARAADLPSPVQPVAPVAYAPSFSWTVFMSQVNSVGSAQTPNTPPARSC